MAAIRFVLTALAALTFAACATPREAGPSTTRWYGIYIGEIRVGATSSTVTLLEDGQRIDEMLDMLSREADARTVPLSDRVSRFLDATGRTTRIERVTGNGPNAVRVTISITHNEAVATRKTPHDQTTTRISLPADIRFDNGEGLLRSWDFADDSELTFANFNASAVAVEQIVIRSLSADASTGTRRIERAAYRNGALSTISELTIDAEGAIVETSLDILGAKMALRLIPASVAATPPTPASIVASVMMKSPNRISYSAAQGHIRYTFGLAGGRMFDLPQTAEQRTRRDGDDLVVDICEACGPGLPTTADFLTDGLKPTMWLQSTSDTLLEIAALPDSTLDDLRKMQALGNRARRIMNARDFTGHYSALEAARRGAGDCTEDAVLLAALARAAGIPAYVATGLVYSRERYHGVSNVFMPHSWTVAYIDGAWKSFDISLDGFDATHIALSINEGEASALASAQQLAGHLEWRSMSEVRSAPPARKQ